MKPLPDPVSDTELSERLRQTLDRAATDLNPQQLQALRQQRYLALHQHRSWWHQPQFWITGSLISSATLATLLFLHPIAFHTQAAPTSLPPAADLRMLQDMPMLDAIGEDHAS